MLFSSEVWRSWTWNKRCQHVSEPIFYKSNKILDKLQIFKISTLKNFNKELIFVVNGTKAHLEFRTFNFGISNYKGLGNLTTLNQKFGEVQICIKIWPWLTWKRTMIYCISKSRYWNSVCLNILEIPCRCSEYWFYKTVLLELIPYISEFPF